VLGSGTNHCGSEVDQQCLEKGMLDAISNVIESMYPIIGMLNNLSSLQQQIVKAADRLRDGPEPIHFEVC
jgi:hypothetical protein